MLETSALAPVTIPSAALRAILAEVAAEARIPVAPVVVDGRRQARLSVVTDDSSFAEQAYRLEVAPTADGPAVTVRAGDEAGAYYGLLSLARLVVADGPTRWLRAATVDDAPGFARRGAILDPYVLPDVGVTDASRALLLERVRFGVRHKLNFVDILDRTPWPEIVRFCDDHHVELMNGIGYQDRLTVTPRDQVERQLDEMLDAGTRSFSFDWDDIGTTNPEALARAHAKIFLDLYGYVWARDPEVRVSTVLPPYGGIPGRKPRRLPARQWRALPRGHARRASGRRPGLLDRRWRRLLGHRDSGRGAGVRRRGGTRDRALGQRHHHVLGSTAAVQRAGPRPRDGRPFLHGQSRE
jgi:hypothetical protein